MAYRIVTDSNEATTADILVLFDTENRNGMLHSLTRSELPQFQYIIHAGRMRSHSNAIMCTTLTQVFTQAVCRQCESIIIPISTRNLGFHFTVDEMKKLVDAVLHRSAYSGQNDMTVYLVDKYITVLPMEEKVESNVILEWNRDNGTSTRRMNERVTIKNIQKENPESPSDTFLVEFFSTGRVKKIGYAVRAGLCEGRVYYPSGNLQYEGSFFRKGEMPGSDYYGPTYPTKGRFYSESGELVYEGEAKIVRIGNASWPKVVFPEGFEDLHG